MFSARRCSCTRIKASNHMVEKQRWTLQFKRRLASKFARFVSDWKRLEHHGCSCSYASSETQTLMALERKSWRSISDHYERSHRFDAWQTEGGHHKQRRHCFVLTVAGCLEVMLFVVPLFAIFGRCNIIEFCRLIVVEQLSVWYFPHIVLLIIPIELCKVSLCMKFTACNFSLSKSFTMMRFTLQFSLAALWFV